MGVALDMGRNGIGKQNYKKFYRHKGLRQTTIKTVYGEVTYQRIVYEVLEEDGLRHYVYLLDETLELDNVGLISTNMAELLVKGITELSSGRSSHSPLMHTPGRIIP